MPKPAVLITALTLLFTPTPTLDTHPADSHVSLPPVAAPAIPAAAADTIDPGLPSVTPTINTFGGDPADHDALDEALALFKQNNLLLPDLDIMFFEHLADCRGHYGLFQDRYTPWRILICSDLAFVPTHELAHAWEAANLTPSDRAAYLTSRGLTTWGDHDTPWKDRGEENAAFIIQQNLTITNAQLSTPRWLDRINAYQTLTGQPSPQLTTNQTNTHTPAHP